MVLLAVLAAPLAIAGEIPGLPPQLPPFHERDLELTFSNDFLGRGGSVDDYRTQQIIVSAKLSQKWLAVVDHSILTLAEGPGSGRVDQLSASLGYEIIKATDDDGIDTVVAGFGIRSFGQFSGERMQNGFHRLVGSKVENLPYIAEQGSDLTAWFDANHYREFRVHNKNGVSGNWKTGYWLRASSLATTGGQWDNSASVLAVASRSSIDVWLGLRSDWRSGYDDMVLRETAAAEDDLGIVIGARFGALVIETTQQLNNDASYGQLRLVSTGRRNAASRNTNRRLGLETGVLLPDVLLRIAGKYHTRILSSESSRWRESVIVGVNYGEPQFGDENSIFVRTRQIDLGLEFERPWIEDREWLNIYAATGAGWRDERLIGVNGLQGETSQSVGRAALTMSVGMRFNSAGAGAGQRWQLRTQLGAMGILPLDDAELQIDGIAYKSQQPTLNLAFGFTVDFK